MYTKVIASFALIACIASQVYGLEVGEKTKIYAEQCRKENNLEMAQIKEALEGLKLPETEAGKCFVECMLQKAGVLEDGKINAEKAKALNAAKLADKPDILEKANQVVDKCSTVANPGGKCEFGVAIAKCTLATGKELGIPKPIFTY